MQEAWQELVEQVREGGRAGEALGLEEPLEQLSMSHSERCSVCDTGSKVGRSSGRDWW